jgi:hypothetical protein
VLPDDGPPCGGTIVFRGHYGGNGTSPSTWSDGDAIAEATIDWEEYRPHLKMAKDCAKLDELAQEVANPEATFARAPAMSLQQLPQAQRVGQGCCQRGPTRIVGFPWRRSVGTR